jgi:hypothetical protein
MTPLPRTRTFIATLRVRFRKRGGDWLNSNPDHQRDWRPIGYSPGMSTPTAAAAEPACR